jgi:hypothetical protein
VGVGPYYAIDVTNAKATAIPAPAPCLGLVFGGVVAPADDAVAKTADPAMALMTAGKPARASRGKWTTDPDVASHCVKR